MTATLKIAEPKEMAPVASVTLDGRAFTVEANGWEITLRPVGKGKPLVGTQNKARPEIVFVSRCRGGRWENVAAFNLYTGEQYEGSPAGL